MLDITSPEENQGLLVPRISDFYNVITPIANSLLVYYTGDNTFYYYHNNVWHAINPFDRQEGSDDITTKANDNIVVTQGDVTLANGNINITTGNINVNSGNINASDTIEANTFVGNGTIPVGGIIMWTGTTIPDDSWVLCTGDTVSDASSPINGNAIPDLRGRFIVGYENRTGGNIPAYSASSYNTTENTGGEKEHLLTANESGIQSHNHTITDPGHSHTYNNWPEQNSHRRGNSTAAYPTRNDNQTSQTTGSNPTGISINSNTAVNASSAHENRPPYYVLAFIMRIK